MNRTIRAIIGVVLILVITFCAISICQDVGKNVKFDVTARKLYTLSKGTKAILAKLNQPIKVRLYYAETAALKAPDQIKYFNNYYEFVKALLEEYAAEAKGMIDLQVIDPRPFSEAEAQALRYGLRKFQITEEESFFFGLAVQTSFGVEKTIPFFSPDRQSFIEYDISYLIDTTITRQKRRIGVLSSLPVMGDDVSGYMAQMMRMQRQTPRPAWTFVEQLRQQYEVKSIPADANDINDVDILLVIHPKDLPEQTLFAIDQFVLKGGRTVICVDPHCMADQPDQRAMQTGVPVSLSSDLNLLLRTWGLEMPKNTFAGDRSLALRTSVIRSRGPEMLIGFLNLTAECFNKNSVITTELNQVRVLFSGVLREVAEPNDRIELKPLITTSNRGNEWKVTSPYELMMPNPSRLMDKFIDGTEPVAMGYQVSGRFASSFPDGIEIEIEIESEEDESSDETKESDEKKKVTKKITGLTEAAEDCVVVVFSDVDFITDRLAYSNFFFGKVAVGDNGNLMLNTIDDLSGSTDLISIRSRGTFKRPFVKVDQIETRAEAETVQEEAGINAEITGFQSELQSILTSAKKGEEEIIGSVIVQKKKALELKIHQARRQLNDIKLKRREQTEHLGNLLRNFNMLPGPAVVLIIAVVLGIRRSIRKRHYISHASDS